MPQINKKNFTTTDDSSDIFTIATPGGRFTNLGNLTTSGDLSSPIRVAADGVTVNNLGNLVTGGNGAPGIVAGEIFGASYVNVTVVNYGTITINGDLFDDGTIVAIPGGIEIFGGEHNTAINYGTINAIEGIGLAASNSTVLNYGTINALGAGVYIEGADAPLTNVTAANFGTIHLAGDEGYGMALLADHSTLKNYGTIQLDGVFDFGMALGGVGNCGENKGSILGTGELDRGVLLEGEDTSFVNYGSISVTGDGSVGVRFSGENEPFSNAGTFTNYGRVEGAGWAVRGSASNDSVVNRGLLAGTVDLGDGDDRYVAGHGGSLSGELILGDGNDLIVCERGCGQLTIGDFLVGSGSDDLLDLSAFGFHSLDDILAHALQDGSNVLLNLSGHDQVVLEDVSLASLAADDFVFGGLATLGGFGPAFGHDSGASALSHPDLFVAA
jgi:hypothetical protein